MQYTSKLIEDAVKAFASLPGVGEKTALRMVLHMLKNQPEYTVQFSHALIKMRENIRFCQKCGNIADDLECSVCLNPARETGLVCVVENIRDIMAIENTGTYKGLYHVLGGVISPVDGVGPEDLNIESLVGRVEEGGIEEVIMALSPTMQGDTTIFYLSRRLQPMGVNVTSISRGVSFGGELEYTDELTLARSIASRIPFDNYLSESP